MPAQLSLPLPDVERRTLMWLWAFCCFVVGLWVTACQPVEPIQDCSSHAACTTLDDGRARRCIQQLDNPTGFRCGFHCVDDQGCETNERCVQAECITPDQACWGSCQPKPGPCVPDCDTGQTCREGRCVDTQSQPACTGDLSLRPTLRSETMGIYDAKRKRLVMFGGDLRLPVDCDIAPTQPFGANDLWIYDTRCTTFQRASFQGSPQARSRGIAVYDEMKDRMLIFGGRYRAANDGKYQRFNDVWSLSLETFVWEALETQGTKPFPRSAHTGVLDTTQQELLIFGGDGSDTEFQFLPRNDLWALELSTHRWREIQVVGEKPNPRMLHAAAWDKQGQRLFVFGGGDRDLFIGPFFNDVWMWERKTSTWTQLHDGKLDAPARRVGASMTYDAEQDRLVLFGGQDDSSLGNNNSTWAFAIKDKAWQVLSAAEVIHTPADNFCKYRPDYTVPNLNAPERRSTHFSVLDLTRREWLIFGGKTDCGMIDDLWSFDLHRNEWIQIKAATQGESCFRGDNPNLCKSLCQ